MNAMPRDRLNNLGVLIRRPALMRRLERPLILVGADANDRSR